MNKITFLLGLIIIGLIIGLIIALVVYKSQQQYFLETIAKQQAYLEDLKQFVNLQAEVLRNNKTQQPIILPPIQLPSLPPIQIQPQRVPRFLVPQQMPDGTWEALPLPRHKGYFTDLEGNRIEYYDYEE